MTPETITLGMKIGMGISGFMLVGGIITTVIVVFVWVTVCLESPGKIKSAEQYLNFFFFLLLTVSIAILLFLGSIAVKIHMWMWVVR